MFENLLNPILNPLLVLHPLWSLLILSFLISLIITLIYKAMTDQDLMKQLKSETKEFQKEMKELKDHPKKMMAVQKKAMQTNMKYMGLSMKPTLVTFIPIIIIFGWMHAHLAYEPILPNQDFTVTANFKNAVGNVELSVPEGLTVISNPLQEIMDNKANWLLKGDLGEYVLEYEFEGNKHTQELLIADELAYKTPIKLVKKDKLKSLHINNEKLKVMNLFGWQVGWLGTYIIFSLIFSMALRKMMNLA
jgi:uncharacterized membrane protein (DUF106 family)